MQFLTMIILTLCVTGLGLLSSSSASTRAKWLSCQIGRPSRLSLESCMHRHTQTHRRLRAQSNILLGLKCSKNITHHPYLQNQGDTGREEGHEDEIVSQYRHTAETTHDLELRHTCKRQEFISTHYPWILHIQNSAVNVFEGKTCLTWCQHQ